jgi:hypothetical protein
MKYTKEEVIEKFGGIELAFSSYYKYSFNFTFKDETLDIYGSFGGSHDDIYRYDCSPNKKVLIKDFQNELMSLNIKESGEVVFEYND